MMIYGEKCFVSFHGWKKLVTNIFSIGTCVWLQACLRKKYAVSMCLWRGATYSNPRLSARMVDCQPDR